MLDAPWLAAVHDPASYEKLPRWPAAIAAGGLRINSTAGLVDFIERNLTPTSVVAELGVFAGVSTVAFARRVGFVHAIDMEIHDVARQALAHFPHVELIAADSIEAAELVADASIDCLYLDTVHTRDRVRRELKAWRRKMKPNGIAAGHDFIGQGDGVAEAVFDTFDRVTVFRDSTWCAPFFAYSGEQ